MAVAGKVSIREMAKRLGDLLTKIHDDAPDREDQIFNVLHAAWKKGRSEVIRRGANWEDPGAGIACFVEDPAKEDWCLCGAHISRHYGGTEYRCHPRNEDPLHVKGAYEDGADMTIPTTDQLQRTMEKNVNTILEALPRGIPKEVVMGAMSGWWWKLQADALLVQLRRAVLAGRGKIPVGLPKAEDPLDDEMPDALNDCGSLEREDLVKAFKLMDEGMPDILERLGPFTRAGLDLGILVDEKQAAYGNSVGHSGAILKILYPDGVHLDSYGDMMLIVRVLDKFSRLASNPKGDLMGESPWRDVAGYGLLGQAQHDKRNES